MLSSHSKPANQPLSSCFSLTLFPCPTSQSGLWDQCSSSVNGARLTVKPQKCCFLGKKIQPIGTGIRIFLQFQHNWKFQGNTDASTGHIPNILNLQRKHSNLRVHLHSSQFNNEEPQSSKSTFHCRAFNAKRICFRRTQTYAYLLLIQQTIGDTILWLEYWPNTVARWHFWFSNWFCVWPSEN